MAHKVGWLVIVLALVLPAFASPDLASLAGTITDSAGAPQISATVEITRAGTSQTTTVFTDDRGRFRAADLPPGTYSIKASAASFLPALRENINLFSGSHLILDFTLNTLSEAMEWLPVRARAAGDEDEWKWTLRSASNRPILRVLDQGSLVVVSGPEGSDEKVLKARVAFVAGGEGEGFGSTALGTQFMLERSLFSSGTISVGGSVGYADGDMPSGVLRASYRHQMPNGSAPELALTVRRLAVPDPSTPPAIEAVSLLVRDRFQLANLLELDYGAELQSVQFMGRAAAVKPFLSAGVHLGENTILGYRYATFQPSTRGDKGFDTAPADLTESGPRMSLLGGAPALERGSHHEVSLSRRLGETNLQLAVFSDRLRNASLTGVGHVTAGGGDFLPDVFSGTFAYYGGNLETSGLRVVAQRRLSEDLTATLDYAWGGVLTLDEGQPQLEHQFVTRRRHALATRVSGRMPGAHTRWIASYRWTSGSALTPVDAFDDSPGQSDPYFSLFIRQPLPSGGLLPGNMEAMIDIRNLLAEGYLPVLGQDGETLYLVQAPRSVRGGLAFTF